MNSASSEQPRFNRDILYIINTSLSPEPPLCLSLVPLLLNLLVLVLLILLDNFLLHERISLAISFINGNVFTPMTAPISKSALPPKHLHLE